MSMLSSGAPMERRREGAPHVRVARRPSTTLLRGSRRRRAHAARGLGRARPASGQYGLLRHRVSLQTFLVVPFPFPYRHAVDVD